MNTPHDNLRIRYANAEAYATSTLVQILDIASRYDSEMLSFCFANPHDLVICRRVLQARRLQAEREQRIQRVLDSPSVPCFDDLD